MNYLEVRQIIPEFINELIVAGAIAATFHDLCTTMNNKAHFISDIDKLFTNYEDYYNKDEICFVSEKTDASFLEENANKINNILNEFGRIAIVFHGIDSSQYASNQLDKVLANAGWILYREVATTVSNIGEKWWGGTLVKANYSPVNHARKLAQSGRPDYAIMVLDEIPESLLNNSDVLLLGIALEKQRHYSAWQKLINDPEHSHALFSKERCEFGKATSISYDCVESYQLHSRFWSHIGRNDMARRVLNSIVHVQPDAKTDHLIQILNHQNDQPKTKYNPELLDNKIIEEIPGIRILIITHDYPDYGMDTLYSGLCTMLGDLNVVESPWKPTLHGLYADKVNNYPCFFNYPGERKTVDELIAQLRNSKFDLIVFADSIKLERKTEVQRLVNANPDLPVVLYDTWDDCYTPMHLILDYIGRSKIDLIFKREMIEGVNYGADTYPLPFSYPEQCIEISEQQIARNNLLFWAGKREHGLRPLYIRSLEKILGRSLEDRFEQADYKVNLRSSIMGLSFFGFGFDTVRYWELPANGVMLMAERPPIRIPNNFEDNVSAVFFDDVADMEIKLNYYLAHPEKASIIADCGYKHYRRYHTSTARAKQFLGIIRDKLF